ncbi:hypothetical protein AB0H71_06425 [Nocardia sp. NPDC050697]|uniref:hypothetical protein n=1 Tax=Nocardia sp. NPDC050697 TaxID=3155158 RepID=UPI0033F7D044
MPREWFQFVLDGHVDPQLLAGLPGLIPAAGVVPGTTMVTAPADTGTELAALLETLRCHGLTVLGSFRLPRPPAPESG